MMRWRDEKLMEQSIQSLDCVVQNDEEILTISLELTYIIHMLSPKENLQTDWFPYNILIYVSHFLFLIIPELFL